MIVSRQEEDKRFEDGVFRERCTGKRGVIFTMLNSGGIQAGGAQTERHCIDRRGASRSSSESC